MTDSRIYKILIGSLLLLSYALGTLAFAEYPEKPVNLMIPYGGGGTTVSQLGFRLRLIHFIFTEKRKKATMRFLVRHSMEGI